MRPHGSIILPHTRARRSRRRLTPTVRRLAFVVMVSTRRIVESELESPRLYAKSQEDFTSSAFAQSRADDGAAADRRAGGEHR